MPDVIAEQGALQDAIESPSTSVSRLGAAGWMKGKVADLNAIGVTENVSRLAAAGRIMGGIYDADPLATSTFYAPLLTTLVLSRGTGNPTFTRATTAYVKDFEDVWRQVPSGAARFEGARVVKNGIAVTSEAFDNGAWADTKGGTAAVPVRTGGQTDPLGGTSAWRIQFDLGATPGTAYSLLRNAGGNAAVTPVKSLWIKSNTAGNQNVTLDYNLGASGVVTVTPTWRRYSVLAGSFVNFDIGLRGGITDDTADILIAFAQHEEVVGQSNQNPSEYVSVGVLSAPYHGAGADGVKYFDTENGNSVASNVVTEATGAAIADATLKGYFAEGQRQNRCLYSQDFTNAAWVSGGGGIAVTPNTAVAPDGTTTADTLTASGANGTLIQDLGVVASAAKAGGLYLKRKTGTGNIDLTLDGGSTWTTVAVTSSWLLLEKTQTLADEDFGIRIVTSGDEVYAWQAQVETWTFISSPIPTTTAAVTRNGDVLEYATSNLDALSDYSMYCEVHAPTPAAKLLGSNYYMICKDNYQPMWCIDGGGGSNNSRFYSNNGSNNSFVAFTDAARLNKAKFGCSKTSTRLQSVLNGAAGTPAALGTQVGASTALRIATSGSGSQLSGSIRNVRIFNKALPDATLQSITT